MSDSTPIVTFLFTDIEGSTRLWEQEPERMLPVMARHDAVSRAAVERYRGTIVKMTGDGVHAAFSSSEEALLATLEIQQLLSTPQGDEPGLQLRCGLHAGVDAQRDGDYYGRAVNRAARIMNAAHGGQMLLSQAVADHLKGRLPAGVALRDLGMARLRDLASPEHLYQVEHPPLRVDFPALRSLEGTPNNLTQQLNSFIGREREITEVRKVLGSSRLLTLLGMGGIGKSRLSMQLAADVLDEFPDGVWFVELAALTDPRSVPQAVASVLGVKEDAGQAVVDALIRHVRDLQVLIILDNCEQVIHACADLAKRLLQAGPRLKILASSRDYLQVAGETAYHVPTLSVPDPQRMIELESLQQHEAVRLFIDRAAASRRGFGLTEQNAAAVVQICHQLDGIPLAIELAAARVRALSVETIAARLNDRFRLLVSGDKTVLPRQRTLRALIDWSYDLLSDTERTLFQRLSVFAGGWTLEAAEAVCAGGALRQDEVLDLLTHLVEKSLVVMEIGGERYRMLDTVRHYAQEKLEGSGKETATRDRHLNFYLGVAEQAMPELFGPMQGAWLIRLDSERANFLAAHGWCDRYDSGTERGLRMVSALKFYWLNRGLLGLGQRVLDEALKRAGAQARGLYRFQGLFAVGQLCCFMGRHADASRYLTEGLAIAREIGNISKVAAVLQPLSIAAEGQGDVSKARQYAEEAVALARELGDKRQLAAALNALAQMHRLQGELRVAEPLYQDVLVLARELGDRESIAIGLLNLAMVAVGSADAESARRMLLEVFAIVEEVRSRPVGQSALEVSAGLATLQSETARAARLYGAAEAQAAETGLSRDAADEAFIAPLIARCRDALGAAAFASETEAGRRMSFELAIADARAWLQAGTTARSLALSS